MCASTSRNAAAHGFRARLSVAHGTPRRRFGAAFSQPSRLLSCNCRADHHGLLTQRSQEAFKVTDRVNIQVFGKQLFAPSNFAITCRHVLRSTKSILRLEPLTISSEVATAAEDMAIEGREGERGQTMFTIRLSGETNMWRNAVALTWSGSSQQPKPVQFKANGDIWEFAVGSRVVKLDWTRGLAQ